MMLNVDLDLLYRSQEHEVAKAFVAVCNVGEITARWSCHSLSDMDGYAS